VKPQPQLRPVWSFWSKPAEERQGSPWPNDKLHLLSWILSVMEAKKHYGGDTQLVTDDAGAKKLVDQLGLRFGRVSTALNQLKDYDSSWWALGKIVAYRAQEVPFVHIDSDVILWTRLPEELETADVLAQNPEFFVVGDPHTWYIPDRLEKSLLHENEGWLPREWNWYRAVFSDLLSAVCCGIYGGRRLDFIHHCADLALRIVEHPVNREVLKAEDKKIKNLYLMLIEQFLPVACLEYHTDNRFSKFYGVKFRYLFNSMEDAYYRAFRCGYTHLISSSKLNPIVIERLEARVQKEYPDLYARCMRMTGA
jgi:hypothetical protein